MFDGLIRLWSEKEKKKGRKNTRYPSGVEQHIFPNPWQGVYVEKTGIGVTKQKTTRTEAYSCERWPDTDKFWGRGTNVSQRRHSASFIRAGRKGGGRKKKLLFHFRAADSSSHLFETGPEHSCESRTARDSPAHVKSTDFQSIVSHFLHDRIRSPRIFEAIFQRYSSRDWSNRKVV